MSVLLREVAAMLAPYANLRCRLATETGTKTSEPTAQLILELRSDDQATIADGLNVLTLLGDLRYLADVSQLRDLASRYGIEPKKLELLLFNGRGRKWTG